MVGASIKCLRLGEVLAVDFQFIVQLVRIIALKQEEARSNKAIEMARRLA